MPDKSHNSSDRPGVHLQQPAGHRACLPAEFSRAPALRLYDPNQAQPSSIDRAQGRFDKALQTLPYPGLFVSMCVRQDAMLANSRTEWAMWQQFEGALQDSFALVLGPLSVFSVKRFD
jgi:hypothetical protein